MKEITMWKGRVDMIVTLREIEKVLARRSYSSAHMKTIRHYEEFQEFFEVIELLRRDWQLLKTWAQGEAKQRKNVLIGELQAHQTSHRDLLESIVEEYRTLGVEPAGSNLAELVEAWEQVSDTLARRERDARILDGEANRQNEAELEAKGLVQVAEPGPTVEAARRIRDQLEAAGGQAAHIEGVRSRIDAVDPYAVDEEIAGWQAEYVARGLLIDTSEGRPMIDPALGIRLQALGIEPWADPSPDSVEAENGR